MNLEKRAVADVVKKKAIILGDVILDMNSLISPLNNIYLINCKANIKQIIAEGVYLSGESNLKIEKITANEVYLSGESNLKGDITSEIFVIEEGSIFNGHHESKYKK